MPGAGGTGMVVGPSGGPSWRSGPDPAAADAFGSGMAGSSRAAGPPMTRGAIDPGGLI
jgi:hypothetical protein